MAELHLQRPGEGLGGAFTWGIDQSHVVPSIQSPLLHESSSHSLGPFVQLDTGCSAGDCALEKNQVYWCADVFRQESFCSGTCVHPSAHWVPVLSNQITSMLSNSGVCITDACSRGLGISEWVNTSLVPARAKDCIKPEYPHLEPI